MCKHYYMTEDGDIDDARARPHCPIQNKCSYIYVDMYMYKISER